MIVEIIDAAIMRRTVYGRRIGGEGQSGRSSDGGRKPLTREERRGGGSKRPRDHKGKGNDNAGRPGQSGQSGRNERKPGGGRPGKPTFGGKAKAGASGGKNKSGRSGKGKGGKRR